MADADRYTLFSGHQRLAGGDLQAVAIAAKTATEEARDTLLILSDTTGQPVDLDLRGGPEDIAARYAPEPDAISPKPGRGRPKLGVTAREVTLHPRSFSGNARTKEERIVLDALPRPPGPAMLPSWREPPKGDGMRLYLSSFRMGDRFDRLLEMAGPTAKVAVVSNAVDFMPPETRRTYLKRVFDPVAQFQEHGLEAHDLDLRAYFGRPRDLEAALADVGLIWAVGGNTFLLRRAMRQSGLDVILPGLLREDRLVYGGWSAGAVVAGPTLRGIEMMDEPYMLAEGYAAEPVWEGLDLIDVTIVPHFESDHPEAEAAARTARHMAALGQPHQTLRDGEAIIVDGDRRD